MSVSVDCNSRSLLYYPKNYDVFFDSKDLQKLQEHVPSMVDQIAHKVYGLSRILLAPAQASLKLIATSLLPNPGAGKDEKSIFGSKLARILSGTIGICGLIGSCVFAVICSPVHLASLWAHKKIPLLRVICPTKDQNGEPPRPANPNHLHLETQNLGLVPEFVRITNDLRPVKERSLEIVKSIAEDPQQADVLCLQETFESEALCQGLKKHYPYIISDILPSITGFTSGISIASKHPIEGIRVRVLNDSCGVDSWAAKSLVRATLSTPIGKINVYTVHTQSLVGGKEAEIRRKQFVQIKEMMKNDFREDGIDQVVTGDFNTGTKNLWGHSALHEKNPEKAPLAELETFVDPFLKDHDRITGERVSGNPTFLGVDNRRMGVKLPEPSGSWNVGPYADPTTLLGFLARKKLKNTSAEFGYPHEEKGVSSTWGTSRWFETQPTDTARLDYVLFPPNQELDADVETRRRIVASGTQSGPSDHNPVAAIIYKKV